MQHNIVKFCRKKNHKICINFIEPTLLYRQMTDFSQISSNSVTTAARHVIQVPDMVIYKDYEKLYLLGYKVV
jgi:hypothetical protein